jgi:hypothetical protein
VRILIGNFEPTACARNSARYGGQTQTWKFKLENIAQMNELARLTRMFGLVRGASQERTLAKGSTNSAGANLCGGNRVERNALGAGDAVSEANMFLEARMASFQHALEARG